MINFGDIISRYLNLAIEAIRVDQKNKGMVASGKSAEGLFVDKKSETEIQITDPSGSFVFQQSGRPGEPPKKKWPPVDVIKQWIIDKGLDYEDVGLNSLTYLIGRKIYLDGTDIWMGKRHGISLNEIIKSHSEMVQMDISKTLNEEILNKIAPQ